MQKKEFKPSRSNPDTEVAVQYLIWALEEIEKSNEPKAAFHARNALEELRSIRHSKNKADARATMYAEDANRFRDKADDAEQLVGLAVTASRRDALTNVAESYKRAAEQMDRLSDAQKQFAKSK